MLRAQDSMTGEREETNVSQLRLDLVHQEGTSVGINNHQVKRSSASVLYRGNGRFVKNSIPCTSAELWRKYHLDKLQRKGDSPIVPSVLKKGNSNDEHHPLVGLPDRINNTALVASITPSTLIVGTISKNTSAPSSTPLSLPAATPSGQRLKSCLKDRLPTEDELNFLPRPRLDGVRIDSAGPAEVILTRREANEMNMAYQQNGMEADQMTVMSGTSTHIPLPPFTPLLLPTTKLAKEQRLFKGSTLPRHSRPRTVPLSQTVKDLMVHQHDRPHLQPFSQPRPRPFTNPHLPFNAVIVNNDVAVHACSKPIHVRAGTESAASHFSGSVGPPAPPASVLSHCPPPRTAPAAINRQTLVLNPQRTRRLPSRPHSQFPSFKPDPQSLTGLTGKRAVLTSIKRQKHRLHTAAESNETNIQSGAPEEESFEKQDNTTPPNKSGQLDRQEHPSYSNSSQLPHDLIS